MAGQTPERDRVPQRQASNSGAYLASHVLAAHKLTFDLDAEAARLRGEAAQRQDARSGHAGVPLVNEGGLAVVLSYLARDATMDAHAPRGPLTVLVLEGRIVVRIEYEDEIVEAGHLLALNANVSRTIRAVEDSVILTTAAVTGD